MPRGHEGQGVVAEIELEFDDDEFVKIVNHAKSLGLTFDEFVVKALQEFVAHYQKETP